MLLFLVCVFVEQMQISFCWVIQFFSFVCIVKGYYDFKEMMGRDQDCLLFVEEVGIIWDSICFFFLLLQCCVFFSYYYLYVRVDFQVIVLLVFRGFVFYNVVNFKSIDFYCRIEEKFLVQLKRQMECICVKQEKYRQGWVDCGYFQDILGFKDLGLELGFDSLGGFFLLWRQWWWFWLDYVIVIYFGDYFLFEFDSEEEEEVVFEDFRLLVQSVFQMVYQVWVINVQMVLRWQQQEQVRQEQVGQLFIGGGFSQEVELVEGFEEVVVGWSYMVQRVLSMVQFFWVLGQVLVDGLMCWLQEFIWYYSIMSDVLWVECYVFMQEFLQGGEVYWGILDQLYISEVEVILLGFIEVFDVLSIVFSGLGVEELFSSMIDDMGSFLSIGYYMCSGSEEVVVDFGEYEVGVFLYQGCMWMVSELLLDRCLCILELEEVELFVEGQGWVLWLLWVVYQCVVVYLELFCYFIIIFNYMVMVFVGLLVLFVFVFLWVMLFILWFSKCFWMMVIVFIEVLVVVKYLFQFGFFFWNSYVVLWCYENKFYFLFCILGLEKIDGYIKYDLVQFMVFFFYCFQLLCYGFWDYEEDLLFKEYDKSGRKEQGVEEGLGVLLEFQVKVGIGFEEELGVFEVIIEDYVQVEVRVVLMDGILEF